VGLENVSNPSGYDTFIFKKTARKQDL